MRMLKSTVWLGAGLAFAASLAAARPAPPSAKPAAQTVQGQPPTTTRPWQKVERASGSAAAVANAATHTIWVAAVHVPGQTESAEAGFTIPMTVSPTDVPESRAIVGFFIKSASGVVACRLVVEDVTSGLPLVTQVWTGGGTGTHGVTTAPFTRRAGQPYQVRATVLQLTQPTPGGYAIVEIGNARFLP